MRSSSALRKVDTRSADACLQGVHLDLMQIDMARISYTRLLAWNDFLSMNSRVSLHLHSNSRGSFPSDY